MKALDLRNVINYYESSLQKFFYNVNTSKVFFFSQAKLFFLSGAANKNAIVRNFKNISTSSYEPGECSSYIISLKLSGRSYPNFIPIISLWSDKCVKNPFFNPEPI